VTGCWRSPKSMSYVVKENAEDESESASPSSPPSIKRSITQSDGRLVSGGGRERLTRAFCGGC
jgi:hypothetical protein